MKIGLELQEFFIVLKIITKIIKPKMQKFIFNYNPTKKENGLITLILVKFPFNFIKIYLACYGFHPEDSKKDN